MISVVEQGTTIFSTRVYSYRRPSRINESTSGLYYHFVFHAGKELNIIGGNRREKFYSFVFGCVQKMGGTIESIGGKGGSVHLLVAMPPSQTPVDFLRRLKLFTATWVRQKLSLPGFLWQEEEVSTVSQSQCAQVSSFIQSQNFL